jgi:hypothetical protein
MRTATGFVVAGLVAGSVLVASPAPATSPNDRVTSFLIDARGGKGLVALTQGTGGSELAFNLFGLKPRTQYRLIVSSRGCASARGTITSKTFRTTPRGSVWDPAEVQSTATPRSARIVRVLTGRTVACSNQPRSSNPPPDVTKLTNASPGLLVVAQNPPQWQVTLSITGLRRNQTYQLLLQSGGCATPGTLLAGDLFTADARGAALIDYRTPAVAGQSIGWVSFLQRSNLQTVFCETL